MNVPTKVFGREPAAIVGTIQAVLALLISFDVLDGIGLDTDLDLAIVMGVVGGLSALYLAYVTSETLLAPIIEVIKASIALGAIYGLSITAEQTGLLIAATTAILAGYQRGQTAPLDNPTFGYIAPDDTVTAGANATTVVVNAAPVSGNPKQPRPELDEVQGDPDTPKWGGHLQRGAAPYTGEHES